MLDQLFYGLKVMHKRGLGFFYTYFRESIWFDLKHRTKTSSRVPKDQQLITSSGAEVDNGLLYVASFTSVTDQSLEIAQKLLGDEKFINAQFIDLGCGKGKALLVYAMRLGKTRTHVPVGIEYDSTLAEMAKANVIKCGFRPEEVLVVADSATEVCDYISSDVLIIYLYNSFQGETLKTVLRELASYPHILIYVDPAEKHVLQNFDYTVQFETQGKYNANTWLVATSPLVDQM